jgi:hypothetical protein
MLLAKSCHDIDWITYIMPSKCKRVSSFGSLKHFNYKNKPEGSSERCLDCKIEKECSYSAKKIYLDNLNYNKGWYLYFNLKYIGLSI